MVPLAQEPGHTDPADTTWTGTVARHQGGRHSIGMPSSSAASRANSTIRGRNN